VTGEPVEDYILNGTLAIEDGATKTDMGYLYAYDEEKNDLIKITSQTAKELGVLSVNLYTIDDLLLDKIFYTVEDGIFKNGYNIEEGIRFWSLPSSEGGVGNMTRQMMTEALVTLREHNSKTGDSDILKVLIFTYVDEDGETKAVSMLPEYRYFDANGNYKSHGATPSVIKKFGEHIVYE
jgi:hypothetical protein